MAGCQGFWEISELYFLQGDQEVIASAPAVHSIPPLSPYLCPMPGLTWEHLLRQDMLLRADSSGLTILAAMSF